MRRWSGPVRFPFATLITMLAIAAGHDALAQPGTTDLYEAAVRDLRRAVTPQRDGSHLGRLFALRQLHDPALEPLLRRLVNHSSWQVQVHAILGLAEISEPRRVDPWLVTQVEHQAGETLIANAIDMDLVDREQIRELLGWNELQPISRLILIGELAVDGEPVDKSAVASLAGSAQLRVAGLASVLLMKLGDPGGLSACDDRVRSLPRRERDRHTLFLLEAIRQFEIREALPWVRDLLDTPELDDPVRYWAIFTAVMLDAQGGLTYWSNALGDQPAYRDRVRFGMLLLAAGDDVPPSAYERLGLDDEFLRLMAEAGRAIGASAKQPGSNHEGTNPAEAIIALLDFGHLQSTSWAMSTLEELPDEHAAPVYAHIIDTVERDQVGRAERAARAINATSRLFEIDQDAIVSRLDRAEDDSLTQEVLLLGLFETRSPVAGAAAARVRRIGAGRADSLALLLIARHTDLSNGGTLARNDLETLARIAAGSGRVSEGQQVQAAWLYLKHVNALDRALAQVIDDESP